MQELVLDVEGRIVRLLIEDEAGNGGPILTLVCRAAQQARVVARPISSKDPPPPPVFPGMPRGFQPGPASSPVTESAELRIELSGFEDEWLTFNLADFGRQVSAALDDHLLVVQLGSGNAEAWGLQPEGTDG